MSRKTGFKKEKLEEKILNDLNSFVRFSLNDSRLTFVSITRVNLNPDNTKAMVYWDTYSAENKDPALAAFKEASGRLRSKLASSLQIKAVPELEFHYDSQFEAEKEITDILEKAKTSSDPQE